MAEHQYWVVAELTPTGDASAVLEAGLDTDYALGGQQVGNSVVLHGEYHSVPISELRSVSNHVARLVWVTSVEGGGGATESAYYEPFNDSADPADELQTDPGRWWYSRHFDYYQMRYGIHAAV